MESLAGTVVAGTPEISSPAPIYNCPQCSHWLAEGTLGCPECGRIVYSDYLRELAIAATGEEKEAQWMEARGTWGQTLAWLPVGEQREAVEKRIELIDQRLHGAEERKARWTRRLGPLAPVIFFIAKLKTYFFLLFKLKFLLSFLGFFAIYWALFGWRFGLGFTLAILFHELGHYVAARWRGLKVDLPVFLPGLGAYVRWYSMGINLEDLSSIALAGPFAGLLTSLLCGGIAMATHSPLFSALAHVTAWLNVLNLVPVLGLDGAQATYALDRLQRWLILATTLLCFGLLHEWVFLFIALGMGFRIYQGGAAEKPSTRTMVRYVLLLFLLGLVIFRFPDTTQGM